MKEIIQIHQNCTKSGLLSTCFAIKRWTKCLTITANWQCLITDTREVPVLRFPHYNINITHFSLRLFGASAIQTRILELLRVSLLKLDKGFKRPNKSFIEKIKRSHPACLQEKQQQACLTLMGVITPYGRDAKEPLCSAPSLIPQISHLFKAVRVSWGVDLLLQCVFF